MKSLTLCFILVGLCVASPICYPRPGSTNGWEPTTAPSPSVDVTLRIALRHRNLEKLEQELMAVSDPRSERYGQHYTREQVAELVGPADKEVEAVTEWLTQAGAQDIQFSFAREYCRFIMSIEKVEKLLSVQLMEFKHPEFSDPIIRANTPYCIPEHLNEAIDFFDGLHTFLAPRRPAAKVEPAPSLVMKLTPNDLYQFYNVTEPSKAVNFSSQAPVEFNGNYFSQNDLQRFEKEYVPAVVGQKVEQIFGHNNNILYPTELANLNVQYLVAMGNFVNTSIYMIPCEWPKSIADCYITYTETVLNQTQPPLVQIVSFGMYGGKYNNDTVQRLNQDFQKMGLLGISILVASGDNGVGCNGRCTSFEFDFPSSPYITMVGATYFNTNGIENGATRSSGGFSEDYTRPSYQDNAVNSYFNSGVDLPPSSMYYRNGRAYPDVAAAGEKLHIVSTNNANSNEKVVSGTACSASVFAGLISLLNNDRLSANKSPMGFLNPWLYQNPDMFNSLSNGNNQYCNNNCCCDGFNGAKGWDPVTGLGTPNFPLMQKAAQY